MAEMRETEITKLSTRSPSLASAVSSVTDSQASATSPTVVSTPNGAHYSRKQEPESDSVYIDLLLLGKTGMGKSTTGDKLLAADPYDKNYIGKQQAGDEEVVKESTEKRQFSCDDITLWKLSSEGDYRKAKERIKRIVFQRSIEGENIFDPDSEDVDSVTKDCELLANETSRIRVLDVPGFFGSDTLTLVQGSAPVAGLSFLQQGAYNVQQANLGVMRQILRIQAEKGLIFRRILYFLPFRGPPDRADSVLQSELCVMKYFFGRAIFECMVMVATMPSSVSKKDIFSERDFRKTKMVVRRALEMTFAPQEGNESTEAVPKPPNPPIIYVSLEETGMDIYGKLTTLEVEHKEGLQLKFDEDACARCALKVGYYMKEKVVCIMDDNGVQRRMAYDESLCHPLIIPKYSQLQKVVGGIAYIILLGIPKLLRASWPGFFNSDEECVSCKHPPGSQGCTKVGQLSEITGAMVDHCSELDRIKIVPN